ncbi:AC2 protein [Begomovirus allamandae]|uniref:Transcriptional activator protein n=1 Tax=Begomovirus allamandae TaxID=452758 RepID=A7KX26_9GEMI|nr:AC2 protein [Allamanda leaf curl virus]ABS32016.1 AC2 protein [Allamanda leaf curl virus]
MQHSSPSRSHSIPVKVQHRIAKHRPIRRRRLDLPCGCSIYKAINRADHGFTHRGEHHCGSSKEWRIYLDGAKSPLFQDHGTHQEDVLQEPRHHPCPSQIQPQPQEATGDSQVLPELEDLHSLTSSDLAFLKGF